jgi:hypothetical protein
MYPVGVHGQIYGHGLLIYIYNHANLNLPVAILAQGKFKFA